MSLRKLWCISRVLLHNENSVFSKYPFDDSVVRWSLTNQLLAANYDQLATANWLNSRDGQKNRNRPKPLPRPGVGSGKKEVKHGGGVSRSPEEVRAYLARFAPKSE